MLIWGVWLGFPDSSRAQTSEDRAAIPENPAKGETGEKGETPTGEKPGTPPDPDAEILFAVSGTRLYVSRLTRLYAEPAYAAAYAGFAAGKADELEPLARRGKAGAPARLWRFLLSARALQVTDTLAQLQVLRADFPPLRDWLVLQAARMHQAAGNVEEARALAQVVEAGAYALEGLQIQLELARSTRDTVAMEKLLNRMVALPGLSRAQEAAVRLELAKLMIRRKAPRDAVLAHLGRVWSAMPQTPLSREAEEAALAAYGKGMDAWVDCAQRVERAQRLSDLQLHEAVVETLANVKNCSREEICAALYWRGRSLSFLKKRSEAGKALVAAVAQCEKTRNMELRVRAKYLAGRNARRKGDLAVAAAYFRRVYREHPDDTYADDAMYQEALVLMAQGKAAAGKAKLQEMLRRYPRGDQAGEAAWRLVLEDLGASRWAAAATALASLRARTTPEAPYEDWGRILYWQGRCAQRQKDFKAAARFYAETAATAPGTYHALLALHRMDELNAGDGTAALLRQLAVTSPSVWPWSALDHTDIARPPFSRMVWFAQLGLGTEIARELQALERTLPAKPEDVPAADLPFWRAMMHVYLAAGDEIAAARLQGRILYDYAQGWPAGSLRKLWEVAYPRAYETEIRAAAARFGVNPYLLMGLVREESFFNPAIRSSAGALGLGQLMPATARQWASAAGVSVKTDADLLLPSVNLPITAAYLARLGQLFGTSPLLVAGAYNAGENALSRWRRARPVDLDLWVELLEVSETRNYIKRVISSMFVYHILAGESFPRLALDAGTVQTP